MGKRPRVHIDLTWVFLVALAAELVLNRLVLPMWAGDPSRSWLTTIDRVALYVFHLATLLGAVALGQEAFRLFQGKRWMPAAPSALRWPFVAATVAVGATVLGAALLLPTGRRSLAVEGAVAFLCALIAAGAMGARAPFRLRIGLALMSVPFLVHFYGTLALQSLGDAADSSPLPLRIRQLTFLAMLLVGVVLPACLVRFRGASPLTRPGPYFLGSFVLGTSLMLLRNFHEIGAGVAYRGFGMELGPAPPSWVIGLVAVGAAALAFTGAATLGAQDAGRRRVGLGIALWVFAGTAYQWPLQLAAASLGLLVVSQGVARLGRIDDEAPSEDGYRPPPVSDAAWEAFLVRAAEDLGLPRKHTGIGGPADGRAVQLDFLREGGSVRRVRVVFGQHPVGIAPDWTLGGRPGRVQAMGTHPSPPSSPGRSVRTGDATFDDRFLVSDNVTLTNKVLDPDRRARAVALLDGWCAVWVDRGLVYEVWPGRGAPLDLPLPLTELAFRGRPADDGADKLVRLVALLRDMANAALPVKEAAHSNPTKDTDA